MVQSLVANLLYDILAGSKGEISKYERLYVIHNTTHLWQIHESYLSDLYLECGIFIEAQRIFEKRQSFRKMGDLAWVVNDVKTAKKYYSYETTEHKSDWDRLLKLAYFEKDWTEVLRLFNVMDAFPISIDNQFVLGSSAVPITPIRNIVLLSLIRLGSPLDSIVTKRFKETMGLKEHELSKCYAALSVYSANDIAAFDKKSRPRFIGREAVMLEDALVQGNTTRSNELMKYIVNCDAIALESQKKLHEFLSFGAENELQDYIVLITKSGIPSTTDSMLFHTMGNASSARWEHYSNRNIIRLFSCHPCMNKRHFGQLLAHKFKEGLPPSGQDIVTGMFQVLSMSADFSKKPILDYDKLVSARDWAIYKCQEWVDRNGKDLVSGFIRKWLDHTCSTAKTLYTTGKEKPREPRDAVEWHRIIAHCQEWLAEEWKREIEDSQWKSERQLFLLIKKTFKDYSVVRHASPSWLSPQHYDIYIPELEIAIEYMGRQHYEPIEYFGGENGFINTIARDKKKESISVSCGISVYYVRYDEECGNAINRIVSTVKNNIKGSTLKKLIGRLELENVSDLGYE